MVEGGGGPRGVQEGYILDRGENGGYRIMGRNPFWVKSGQFDDLPWFFLGGFHHIPPPPLSFLWCRSRRKYARVGHLLKLLWNSSLWMWKMTIFQKNEMGKTQFPGIRFSYFWCQNIVHDKGFWMVYKFNPNWRRVVQWWWILYLLQGLRRLALWLRRIVPSVQEMHNWLNLVLGHFGGSTHAYKLLL